MGVFFTADTHFYHKNAIKLMSRPFKDVEEMNNKLIENWNNKVGEDDSIYILGDFSFGNEQQTVDILKQLNGNKYLILGNHDNLQRKPEVFWKFVWVEYYHKLIINKQKIILFHYPIQEFDCKQHGAIHLYGHIHKNQINHIKNTYNVGVDVNNYEPISLNEILERIE